MPAVGQRAIRHKITTQMVIGEISHLRVVTTHRIREYRILLKAGLQVG